MSEMAASIKRMILRSVLVIYTLISGIVFGIGFSFIVIFPILHMVLEHLKIDYGVSEYSWLTYVFNAFVALSVVAALFINRKRYRRYLREHPIT
jgi:hypothetical protein